ncbi:Asparaginyl-tRNA synthetase [Coelomomyces lativittatus]|nr:Asparaginyl-tRNA synthetase [Coelomomyces lativittatus]
MLKNFQTISFSETTYRSNLLTLVFSAKSLLSASSTHFLQNIRHSSSLHVDSIQQNESTLATPSIHSINIQPPSLFASQFFPPTIASILSKKVLTSEPIKVQGWVKTCRPQKYNTFLHLSDGSSEQSLQVVVNERLTNVNTGSSVVVEGQLSKSLPELEQEIELHTTKDKIQVLGSCSPSYPFQKNSDFANMLRTRNALMLAFHDYCKKCDIMYVHTPILTSSQCESGGEVFKVDAAHPTPLTSSEPFFGHPSYLTVSSQLHLELFTNAYPRVYTLSPCFRAEPTQSSRHLAEFHMLELEYAFLDSLTSLCALTTDIIQSVVRTCESTPKVHLIADRVDTLLKPFQYIEYQDAVAYFEKKGVDTCRGLTPEAEKMIAEDLNAPVFLVRYPQSERPFYMKQKEPGIVENFDLILPHVGEVAGGSLRENNLDILKSNLEKNAMNLDLYQWYLDTRKYGSPEHGGFGLGFDRLILYLLGKDNLKDCIGLPRLSKECLY